MHKITEFEYTKTMLNCFRLKKCICVTHLMVHVYGTVKDWVNFRLIFRRILFS